MVKITSVENIKNLLKFTLHLLNGYLTWDQIEGYERMLRAEKRKQSCDKIKAILLLVRGISYIEESNILLIDITTLWHQTCTGNGLKGILQDN